MRKLFPAPPFAPPLRLSLLVLAILADGEAHGYSIMKSIEDLTRGSWRPTPGSLYPLLVSLENEGLIECRIVGEPGVRKRRVCKLTDYGMRYFLNIVERGLNNLVPIFSKVIKSYYKVVKECPSLNDVERKEKINSLVRTLDRMLSDIHREIKNSNFETLRLKS